LYFALEIIMGISIIAFGQLNDIIQNQPLLIGDVKNIDDLKAKLNELFPSLKNVEYAIAVNRKIVPKETTLSEADEVCLLPPFSGG
jgi:molybdopterin converting factor small subunit